VEKMLIDAYTEADEYSKYTGLKTHVKIRASMIFGFGRGQG
jgi:hypothetical protein